MDDWTYDTPTEEGLYYVAQHTSTGHCGHRPPITEDGWAFLGIIWAHFGPRGGARRWCWIDPIGREFKPHRAMCYMRFRPEHLPMPTFSACAECSGEGSIFLEADKRYYPCTTCKGRGRIEVAPMTDEEARAAAEGPCSLCGGTAYGSAEMCEDCEAVARTEDW